MPNWCNNLLTMKSKNRKLLNEVQSSVSKGIRADQEKGLLNHFRPMPDDLTDTVKGFDNSIPEWQKKSSKLLEEKHGADNWYDWAVKNWGTKWDVLTCYDCNVISLDNGVWMLSIQFESAWSPPEEAIEYFVKHVRKTIDSMSEDEVLSSVTLQYIEPGVGYCGVRDFLDESNTFFIQDYTKENLHQDDVGNYIWLEEELEAERAYQKEMDEEWKEESCSY